MTPLIVLDRIAPDLWMKDEGSGPAGSWLDRVREHQLRFEDLLHPPKLSDEAFAVILAEVRQQIGGDVAIVSDGEGIATRAAVDAGLEVLRLHGFLPSIRGAMALLARPQSGRVVVVNPESGLRDLHVYARRFPRIVPAETDKLGGLITPR